MALNIKDGLVQINEASEDKISSFNLRLGFAMLTAFCSKYELSQNRSRNRQLADRLRSLGYSFIRVTGSYVESAESTLESNVCKLTIMEESLLVPVYNIKTKESFDFNKFKSDMIDLCKEFEQNFILVSPSVDQDRPSYIIMTSTPDVVDSVDCVLDSFSIADIANAFFSNREKTLNKGAISIKFESVWLDEPAHTISGVRGRDERNELAPFGSHYYNSSRISNLITLK